MPRRNESVLDRFGRRAASDLHISAVTEAELRRGVAIPPEGRRRNALAVAIDAMVAEDFADRAPAFDEPAAVAFAAIFAERRTIGRPISFPDCQIAATVRAQGAAVATRNVGDFEGCGIEVAWRPAHNAALGSRRETERMRHSARSVTPAPADFPNGHSASLRSRKSGAQSRRGAREIRRQRRVRPRERVDPLDVFVSDVEHAIPSRFGDG